jgi:hypothetical protein
MSTATSASERDQARTARRDDRTESRASARLSVRQLNVMRIGYLLMGVGLAVFKWPLMIDHEPWPLMEGAANHMLVAMGLLALLGLRYPVAMLPILLFESLWKLMWLGVVALPLWVTGRMDADTAQMAEGILWVVVVLAVIPWPYVVRQYVLQPGDAWRSHAGRAR